MARNAVSTGRVAQRVGVRTAESFLPERTDSANRVIGVEPILATEFSLHTEFSLDTELSAPEERTNLAQSLP